MDIRTAVAEPSPSLAHLPVEIQSSIASHLSPKDLCSLVLTCRRLWTSVEVDVWRSVHISDEADCRCVREAIQGRPALAQAVTKLELYTTLEEYDNGPEDIYSDLVLAASMPNLRHLAVCSGWRKYDRNRSRKAAQALAKLSRLEFCQVKVDNEESINWTVYVIPAILSLIVLPSLREFHLHRFNSVGGVTSKGGFLGETLGQQRTTPLKKLSLLACNIDPEGLADLMAVAKPLELELVLDWGGRHSLDISLHYTGYYASTYIETMQMVAQNTLERLTYYSEDDLDEFGVSFDGFKRLKFLRTDLSLLCREWPDFLAPEGGAPSQSDSTHPSDRESWWDFSLPSSLEVLEIMFYIGPEVPTKEALAFLEPKVKHFQRTGDRQLRELRFITIDDEPLSGSELEEVRKFGLSCGISASISHFPENWDE